MFKIGQKIVCIEKFTGRHLETNLPSISPQPVVGEIYTFDGMNDTNKGCFLKEIHALDRFGNRSSYSISKFRPLDYSFAEEVEEMVNKSIVEIEEENLVSI